LTVRNVSGTRRVPSSAVSTRIAHRTTAHGVCRIRWHLYVSTCYRRTARISSEVFGHAARIPVLMRGACAA
jgi:hypothetical protein